ncbi:hypothetical protein LA080_013689 [Diaporthe eres]|nr:hypothetical protein LA080_013689 [Diaporthe eres]
MTTYWLNLRPSQIKDKEIRLLESCGHLDEKIKDVLKYLQDCDIDISELRSQYLLTAAPGLRGTELDLVLYVEYENRLHEIYRKARDLIRAFQTQPDEAEATAEAVQATITEDFPVQNDQIGDVFHPGAQSERHLRRQLVEIDRANDGTEVIDLDIAPHASIIDDRLALELIQAVSTSPPPGSIPSPEKSGETGGCQRPDATPSSTPPDEDIREDNDGLRFEGHDWPPPGLDTLWPQAPTEGLVEAPSLEADLARRASVSTGPDMMEDIADGMRVASFQWKRNIGSHWKWATGLQKRFATPAQHLLGRYFA